MSGWSMGQFVDRTGLSADTLRYYEKIDLLPHPARDGGGRRRYDARNLDRVRFLRRAQAMNFSLAEIRCLLQLRDRPQRARSDVRRVTEEKLADVETRLEALQLLRNELRLLLNLCSDSTEGCPILDAMSGRQPD